MSALAGMTPASFAARRLGVSSRTVRRMIKNEDLRGEMIAGAWYVSDDEVALMVWQRRAAAARLAGVDLGHPGLAHCPTCGARRIQGVARRR